MKTYRESFILRTMDCDVNGVWRLSVILEAIQETAGMHVAQLGCGQQALREKGIAWVLLRNALNMERYPLMGERVSVETFHTEPRHRLFPRYSVIRDGKDRIIGRGSSLWVLMDLQTRHSIDPKNLDIELPDNSDLEPPMPLPPNIPPVESGTEREMVYRPVYTDLDANGHVNNVRYADGLCNFLGVDVMRRYEIASIVLHYYAEVRPEQLLHLTLQQNGERGRLMGLSDMTPMFEIGYRLAPRTQADQA